MRGIKLVAILVVVMALGVITTSVAAAQPEFLSSGGSRAFTGASKKAKLQIKEGATIECTKSKASGSLTSNITASFTVDFEGCKSLGLAANSLGDGKEVILVNLIAETCFINLSPLEAGLIISAPPVHIEVKEASQLVLVKGAFAAKVEPINAAVNTVKLVIAQKGGVQSIDGCRSAADVLDVKLLVAIENEEVIKGESVFKPAGMEAVESTLTFTEAGHTEELMA